MNKVFLRNKLQNDAAANWRIWMYLQSVYSLVDRLHTISDHFEIAWRSINSEKGCVNIFLYELRNVEHKTWKNFKSILRLQLGRSSLKYGAQCTTYYMNFLLKNVAQCLWIWWWMRRDNIDTLLYSIHFTYSIGKGLYYLSQTHTILFRITQLYFEIRFLKL